MKKRVPAALPSVAAAVPTDTATPEPTPTPAPLPPRLWKSYSGGGDTGWWLENGTAIQVTLPVEPGQYYDYNSVNGKILYASHFATTGAGPSNLAASDLWMVDYPSGTPTALIPTDTVVEALWSPDGSFLAMPNYGFAPPTLVIAAADGSLDANLSYAPDVTDDPTVGSAPTAVLWHPDGQHLVAITNYSESMGGPSPVFLFELGADRHTVVSATPLGLGIGLVDWNVPGHSFFILDENANVALVNVP